jgi:hypothetical protein
MIVRLFCPQCVLEAAKRLPAAVVNTPVPVAELVDDGRYQVRCEAGHVGEVILDNLKFELLFELGLNALLDGYPREAVSSFAASLERFQEFYWRVVMAHSTVSSDAVAQAWKPLAKQSERQLGAYVTAGLLLTHAPPPLLNPNKEVVFRNKVIHDGYLPTRDEAVSFGDAVFGIINEALGQLRASANDALLAVYTALSPHSNQPTPPDGNDKLMATVNILTAVDVRHPVTAEDNRRGGVAQQLPRIADERLPHRMQLLSREELERRFPERTLPGGARG